RLAVADGAFFVTKAKEWTITVWGVPEGKSLAVLRGRVERDRGIDACAWAPDGKHLAGVCPDRNVRVWDAVTGEEVRSLRIGQTPNEMRLSGPRLAWSPDGKRLAAVDGGRRAYLWDDVLAPAGRPRELQLAGHTDEVGWLGWAPDSRRLASGGADGTVRV